MDVLDWCPSPSPSIPRHAELNCKCLLASQLPHREQAPDLLAHLSSGVLDCHYALTKPGPTSGI